MRDLGLLPGSEDQRLWLGAIIGQRMEFGVQSSLGATHGLSSLPACWVGSVTMNLDVRGIRHDQSKTAMPGEFVHDMVPDS